MEETKKTTTRGRKPKTDETVKKDVVDIELESKDQNDMIAKLMAQMEEQAKAMARLQEQVNNANKEKSDLQTLVDALKSNGSNEVKDATPKRIKIISLVPNIYNLSTKPNGEGVVYKFEGIGDTKQIRTSDLEDILSVTNYRKQAEEGYFIISNKEFLEEQDIDVKYSQDVIDDVCVLGSDYAVEVLCSMDEKLRDSLLVKIAENIVSGKKIDRNRVFDIKEKIGEDIDTLVKTLKHQNQ